LLYQQNHLLKYRDNKNILLRRQNVQFYPQKRLVAAAKFLVAATKKLFVVPNLNHPLKNEASCKA